ncbi:hypothetical protein CTI12_AA520330 [Artemisia annua]|uniref:HMG box domain-containing protein n=1 Tax=Artemisia annua TaxID=35608 RepID=A0A2U1L855_ARTAN|nr:hypothetical protein CTI12_AA520330 [Artemisia annua]
MRGPKLIAVVAQKKLNTEPVKKITKAKVKKEKAPGAPKRPPSAFFVFMKVAKEGGAKWKAMSESEKAPYVEKAASKKEE